MSDFTDQNQNCRGSDPALLISDVQILKLKAQHLSEGRREQTRNTDEPTKSEQEQGRKSRQRQEVTHNLQNKTENQTKNNKP